MQYTIIKDPHFSITSCMEKVSYKPVMTPISTKQFKMPCSLKTTKMSYSVFNLRSRLLEPIPYIPDIVRPREYHVRPTSNLQYMEWAASWYMRCGMVFFKKWIYCSLKGKHCIGSSSSAVNANGRRSFLIKRLRRSFASYVRLFSTTAVALLIQRARLAQWALNEEFSDSTPGTHTWYSLDWDIDI